jgi:hypothetical protein
LDIARAERETVRFATDEDRVRALGFGDVERRSPWRALREACSIRHTVVAQRRSPLMLERAPDVSLPRCEI